MLILKTKTNLLLTMKQTKMKTEETIQEKFNRWMAEKVHSYYYSDHERMCNAYENLYNDTRIYSRD